MGELRPLGTEADNRQAHVVQQIFLTPKGVLSRAQDAGVKPHFPFVFRHRDISAEDGAHLRKKYFAHVPSPILHVLLSSPGSRTSREIPCEHVRIFRARAQKGARDSCPRALVVLAAIGPAG